MSDVIVFMEDGILKQVVPNFSDGYTADDIIKTSAVPDNADYKKIAPSVLPSKTLRDAWKLNGSSVDIDMVKGKDIAHTLRREKRAEALADNIEIIKQGSAGIPLKAGQSVETAQSESAAYMLIDDANQVSIDNATNEAHLLAVIEIL